MAVDMNRVLWIEPGYVYQFSKVLNEKMDGGSIYVSSEI